MPFYLVKLSSGTDVTVEASSETAAAALALQNYGRDDPREKGFWENHGRDDPREKSFWEEVINVVCIGDSPSDYQH